MTGAQLFYAISGLLDLAGLLRARLAGSKVRLFKSTITVSTDTTLSQLDAAQCDFDGYPAGGVTMSAWSAPVLSPGVGSQVTSPTVQFAFAAGGPGVGNVAGGFYVLTSDGVLMIVGQFPDGVPFQVPGQGTPLVISVGQAQG